MSGNKGEVKGACMNKVLLWNTKNFCTFVCSGKNGYKRGGQNVGGGLNIGDVIILGVGGGGKITWWS